MPGLRIRFPDGQILPVDVKLEDGQFVIYKNGTLYVAGKHREQLRHIATIDPVYLHAVKPAFGVSALSDGRDNVTLQVVSTTLIETAYIYKNR